MACTDNIISEINNEIEITNQTFCCVPRRALRPWRLALSRPLPSTPNLSPPRPVHLDLVGDAHVCVCWSFSSSRPAPHMGRGAVVVGQGTCAVAALPQWTSQGGGMSASRLGGGGAPPHLTHFDLGDDAPVCIFWSFGSSRSAPRGGVLLWWDRVRARRRRRCLGGHRGWVGASFAATGASQVDGGGGWGGGGCGRLR